jgi:hypothetical protein
VRVADDRHPNRPGISGLTKTADNCEEPKGENVKQLLAILLCAALPIATFANDNSYKVAYDGGSLSDVKAGVGLRLYLNAGQIRLVRENADVAVIPATAITEISYGQDVHRRVGAAIGLAFVSFGVGALMALTKSKKHFIGLT